MITPLNDLTHHASRRNVLALIASAIALAALDTAAHAQCQYEVTAILDIGDCDIGDSHTFGQGMNNNGDVVGFYRLCAIGNERAFFWSQETGFITLPHPDDVVRSWAYDISDNGIIVGQHEFTGIGRKGFAYDMATGEYKHLDPLHDGVSAVNVSSANAVNSNGVVAGMRIIGKPDDPQPLPYNAVIWRPFEKGSPVEDLGVMNGPNSWASDITNTSTDTVGSTGTLSQGVGYRQIDSHVELISKFLKFTNSFCHGAGDFGFAAGSGIPGGNNNNSTGFLWVSDNLILLDPLPGFSNCGANDVNAYGHVITRCTPGNVPGLWQNGETFNLQELIVSGGGSIQWPRAINNNGQILTRHGGTRAALITPIEVPLADLNYDCKVDEHDLVILLDSWEAQVKTRGSMGAQTHPADLSGDGTVAGADLLILLANWNP